MQWLHFNDPVELLEVTLDLEVESTHFNAFDFVIFPFQAAALPIFYSPELARLLAPYLVADELAPEVVAWAATVLESAGGQTVAFLNALTDWLKRDFAYTARHKGPPHPPAETLIAGGGSCRDLAWLMIAACRATGLAARFVSGYAWAGDALISHELHAWVEVYLPGAGWRGFDPTLGAAADERHIVLAASAYPDFAAPLRGDFWGNTRSELETKVVLSVKEKPGSESA